MDLRRGDGRRLDQIVAWSGEATKHLATSSSATILICWSGGMGGGHSRSHASIVRRGRILPTLVRILHLVVVRVPRHGLIATSRRQGGAISSLAVAYVASCLVSRSAGCNLSVVIAGRRRHHRGIVVGRRVRHTGQVRRLCPWIFRRSLAFIELVKAGGWELRHSIRRAHLVVVISNVVRDRRAWLHYTVMAHVGS